MSSDAPDPAAGYLAETVKEFRKYRSLAERAMAQVADDGLFFRPAPGGGNPIAIIVKHLGGNLASRWTDFLTTDGEKSWRDRDSEFVLTPDDTWPALRARWDRGWDALFASLASLGPADLERTVTIRGEPHTVIQAAQRALAHASYHVGQIVYLCRISTGESWEWLSVAPGKSGEFLRGMLDRHRS